MMGCDELRRVGDLVVTVKAVKSIISFRHSLHLWRHGRAGQEMGGQCCAFSMLELRQLSAMGMWPVVVHRANATALQPVRTTRRNPVSLVSTTLSHTLGWFV